MYIFNKCRVVLLCILMATSLISCDENAEQRDQYNALFTEVIDLHDELMPKMSELTNLEEQLESQDSLGQADQQILENLKKADSRMMDWMHDFTDTYVKDRTPVAKMTAQELEQGIEGLQGELQEVKDLRDFTHKSLDEATTTLK
ncbi:hypothetical protein [Leeuwenhoekiella sp. ZYFB001]|uniref:hypothetical protein n=1 Tax=Leeuwenhoekiella sp. ZYFB001 TaxID=2719912 RepID=UPI0014321B67|nr:hypothetical protein [Leeuwenhoekiella sp. ZYFB001]